MDEVVYLNEGKAVPSNYEVKDGKDDIWYLDNGSSNHMSGDHRKVRFRVDSRLDIKGKGSMEFIDRNREPRKITNFYFIPELKSNIISLGQTTKSGCDIRMKREYLIIMIGMVSLLQRQ